jgi:hypothetical protein
MRKDIYSHFRANFLQPCLFLGRIYTSVASRQCIFVSRDASRVGVYSLSRDVSRVGVYSLLRHASRNRLVVRATCRAIELGLKNVSPSTVLGGAVTKQWLSDHKRVRIPLGDIFFTTRPCVTSRGQHLRRHRLSCDSSQDSNYKRHWKNCLHYKRNCSATRLDGSINPALWFIIYLL